MTAASFQSHFFIIAAKYAGTESRPASPVGVGTLMNAPTTERAMRIAIREMRIGVKNPFDLTI